MNYFIDSSIDNHHPDNLYLDEPTSFSSHSVGAGLNGFRDNNNTQGEDERMWAAPAPPPPPGFDFTPNSNM
jgi:hypothetical protein